ncbi:DUF2092 domain-containing protein [Candidatus Sumerlaeota bacterium]|nr:DUF2092 domain-containing protein [Candidatus Sumerlaeota bacterium]
MNRAHFHAIRTTAPAFGALALVCLALSLTALIPAQGPDPVGLEATVERVAGAEFTTLHGEIHQRTVIPGIPGEGNASERAAVRIFDVTLERPNRCRVSVISPSETTDGLIVSDGEQILCVSNVLSQVRVGEAPTDLSEISERDLVLCGMGSSVLLPAALGMASPPLTALRPEELGEIQALDSAEIADNTCDVFEITAERGGATLTLTLAIDRESDLLRRVEMTMGAATSEVVSRVTEEYLWLDVDEPIGDGVFEINPPADMPVVSAFSTTALH